jgi:hypothetical protein
MMHLKNSKLPVLFLSAVLVFAACKKDSDNPATEPPVTEPLSMAAAKPGDTIIITGENFSEVAANNTVKFNGVTATVVSATATQIVVVIPANASSGTITVTVNGKTTEVGTLTIAPLTLYTIKESDSSWVPKRLIAIDPANGKETEIATLTGLPQYSVYRIKYLAATNEIVRYNDSGTMLLKINVTTKAESAVRLSGDWKKRFDQLVTDKSGALYSIQDAYSGNTYETKLVKIDPKTGSVSVIQSANAGYLLDLVYVPARNEIAGIADGTKLFRLNLTTKDTASIQLTSQSSDVRFTQLVVDNQSNLIASRNLDPAPPAVYSSQLVKIEPVTGAQTVVTALSEYFPFSYGTLTFLPERNEITGIWNNTSLYRFNVTTKATSMTPVNTIADIHYNGITHN